MNSCVGALLPVGEGRVLESDGQVGHGRRLNSCFCRKAFKEIGHANSTDDDDDTAVEAPVKKKEALPAFALDFGNGA